MSDRFELLLFSLDDELVRRAGTLDVDGVVVDLEQRGKESRQRGRDTDVSAATIDDLTRVRRATDLPVIARIDGVDGTTPAQVAAVLRAGADEVLVPMVRSTAELDRVIELVDGRAAVSCMVETAAACEQATALAERPLRRMYLGLHDLAIDRGSRSIFDALADGTADHVRRAAGAVPFGLAGLTHPEAGTPIPCQLLIGELERLGANFTFLRRSFLADRHRFGAEATVAAIRAALAEARSRTETSRTAGHRALRRALTELAPA